MRQRHAHIFERETLEHYVEPSWVATRLFEVEQFPGTVWDPACGWGTITTAAQQAGHDVVGSDVVDRQRHQLSENFRQTDFLHCTSGPRQPFSVVESAV